jgi:hypothetical protein
MLEEKLALSSSMLSDIACTTVPGIGILSLSNPYGDLMSLTE